MPTYFYTDLLKSGKGSLWARCELHCEEASAIEKHGELNVGDPTISVGRCSLDQRQKIPKLTKEITALENDASTHRNDITAKRADKRKVTSERLASRKKLLALKKSFNVCESDLRALQSKQGGSRSSRVPVNDRKLPSRRTGWPWRFIQSVVVLQGCWSWCVCVCGEGGSLCVEIGSYADVKESRCNSEIKVCAHFYEILVFL